MHALALFSRTLHPCLGALANQRALKLCQARHDDENHLALWGGGVDVLLVGDEVNTECPKLVKCGDEGFGGTGKAIIPPDKYDVGLAFANDIEELLIFWPLFIAPRGVVDVFGYDGEVSGFGVGAELTELVFGCLLPLGG